MSRPWRPSCPSSAGTQCVSHRLLNLDLSTHHTISQDAAQQHQVNLTERYDLLLACEPSPPSESAANPNVNLSLQRLHQVLQATLLSIAGIDPTGTLSEAENANVEASSSHLPAGARPSSETRERRVSDVPPPQPESGLGGGGECPQPDTSIGPSIQVESEPQARPSASEPPISHDSTDVPTIAAVSATVDDTTTTDTTTPPNPTGTDPPSTTQPETADADLDLDWSEDREHEISRLESENARLRALLGIDSAGLAAAGVPDIDPEPPLVTSSFHGFPHPSAAGSSAWANSGTETANPFTFGFREDPSVLGLAATPSRLHTLTPPNAPHAIMTAPTSTTATSQATAGGTLTGRAAGVFVSASWAPSPAGGNGPGVGVGVGIGPGGQGPGQGMGIGSGTGTGPGGSSSDAAAKVVATLPRTRRPRARDGLGGSWSRRAWPRHGWRWAWERCVVRGTGKNRCLVVVTLYPIHSQNIHAPRHRVYFGRAMLREEVVIPLRLQPHYHKR
jgi:hypothetical protein